MDRLAETEKSRACLLPENGGSKGGGSLLDDWGALTDTEKCPDLVDV